jgi:hypothetical protein
MKRGSEHQFHKSTTTGPGHTAVCCYFSSLITAHSALFTTSSPSSPRNPLSPHSDPFKVALKRPTQKANS